MSVQSSLGSGSGSLVANSAASFTVVKNRSDQWPLYSMIAATVGLLITFLTKLGRFIRRTAVTPPAA